jgi:MbtH protein
MEASSTSGNWQIDGDEFIVLVNGEEQYSIWPSAKAVPLGWRQVGPKASKAECLAFVEQHWTDMRPKSLQDQMKRA